MHTEFFGGPMDGHCVEDTGDAVVGEQLELPVFIHAASGHRPEVRWALYRFDGDGFFYVGTAPAFVEWED